MAGTDSGPRTLLDLPRELLVKIIEQKCISLEDRMNLRLTCKTMANAVQDSEFFSESPLEIRQDIGEETTIEGLLTEDARLDKDGKCHHEAFIRLMSRLFLRVHFDSVEIQFCNSDSYVPNGLNVCHLVQLFESITSDKLEICSDQCDAKMFSIIAAVNPSTELNIRFNDLDFDVPEEPILALPAVSKLTIDAGNTQGFMTDALLLALAAKHRYVLLNWADQEFTPNFLLEATKIIAERDHYLTVNLSFNCLLDSLKVLGIRWGGGLGRSGRFSSQDPSIKIAVVAHYLAEPYGGHEECDYTIDVNGTTISIYDVFTSTFIFTTRVHIGTCPLDIRNRVRTMFPV